MEDLGDHLLIKNVTPVMKEAIAKLLAEESEPKIYNGVKIWENKDGKPHRDGDLPAKVFANGDEYWYQNGEKHRDGDLPAVVCVDGTKAWYDHGKQHRPFQDYPNGAPAASWSSRYLSWYNKDCKYAQLNLETKKFTIWPKDMPKICGDAQFAMFSFDLKNE